MSFAVCRPCPSSAFRVIPRAERARRRPSRGNGRPGRNRTRNPRFWRPVLYQLSYRPAVIARVSPRRLFRLLVLRVLVALRTVLFLNEPVGVFLLVFLRRVVPALALVTGENDGISHDHVSLPSPSPGREGLFARFLTARSMPLPVLAFVGAQHESESTLTPLSKTMR